MKKFITITLIVFSLPVFPQEEKPKLLVGIVVDQMRADYLYRYRHHFSENGFNKLLTEGFQLTNAHYNYMPTYTGPGHASIYTGTTPAVHGIIANDWYDKKSGKVIYCVKDTTEHSVGSDYEGGKMAPKNLLTTTIGDQLRLVSNFKSKVVAVSLKDRAAILPAGHSANGAYWLDDNGNFISSTHYMETLPKWVQDFNQKKLASKYLSEPWRLSLPIEEYSQSTEDKSDYEKAFSNEKAPVFPHDVASLGAAAIKETPMGNTLIKDMALAAIKGEDLGKDEYTDLLAISFSSTDYVGHRFGTNAIETEDTYIKLDREIAEIISHLDEQIGKENYVLFLTADHGAVEVPSYLKNKKIPAGNLSSETISKAISDFYQNEYGSSSIFLNYSNYQVFLNYDELKKLELDADDVIEATVEHLVKIDGIAYALSKYDLLQGHFDNPVLQRVKLGYHQKMSGDVALVMQPGWIAYGTKGTTHCSPYNYDTHVPLIWYGKNIPKGTTSKYTAITDIVPTLSIISQSGLPNGSIGNPISKLLE